MSTKIAILRGINVGGKRKILMTDLKLLCETLGWKNVKTYIQSGNLIFTSKVENSKLENMLEKAITEKYGFDVPVIIRNADELKTTIDKNPFYKNNTDISHLYLTFLKQKVMKENISQIQTYNFEPDKFEIRNQDVFIYCEGKYHQSKLTNNFFEKKLKVGATTRNWKTVLKLQELAGE